MPSIESDSNISPTDVQSETAWHLVSGLILTTILLFGSIGWGFSLSYYQKPIPNQNNVGAAHVLSPFETLHIRGKAVYVYDVAKRKVIYEKNASAQLPLASLTKLLTVLLAIEHRSLNDRLIIPKFVPEASGGSLLVPGSTWSIRDLITYALVASSNDAAAALAYAVLVAQGEMTISSLSELYELSSKILNIKSEALGLTETYFLNPTGLDSSEEVAGAYGSAQNVGTVLEALILRYPELMVDSTISTITIHNAEGESVTIENTNPDASAIAGISASKTGYTDLAGGNLAIAFNAEKDSHPIIIVVLGSTREDRFHDVESLVAVIQHLFNTEQPVHSLSL